MNEENTQNNQNSNWTGVSIGEDLKTIQLQKQEEELKQYTQENIKNIINAVMKNTNNKYREIKYVHASWHGGQKINHGNSKAQLHFNIDNFYNDFDIKDKTRDDFVKIVGEKHITHDQSKLILENQETRYALKNKEKLLNYLKDFLYKFFWIEEQKIEKEIKTENDTQKLHHNQTLWESENNYENAA